VDTCQAGAGVAEAAEVASALWEEVPPDAEHVWFGIMVSCSAADIGARDGAFGKNLTRLLRDGPQSADMRRRWSRHNRLIRGDDLGQALLDQGGSAPGFPASGQCLVHAAEPAVGLGCPGGGC
jgi:hypothetical protein